PVSVRERVVSYWLRKFVARHRFGVMVAVGICLTALSAIVGLAWTLNVVEDARREAVDSGKLAAEQRDTALSNSYAASVTAAQFAMESGRASTAVQQLRATDPSRRGWEWRHLAAQSSHESQRIEPDTE